MSFRDRGREREQNRRREFRDLEPKRRRSGFDQERTSGDDKRLRKDADPVPVKSVTSVESRLRRQFYAESESGPVPVSDSKHEKSRKGDTNEAMEERKKNVDNVLSVNSEGKRNEDPAQVPRARTYFQHDERSSAGQVGRSFGRRAHGDRSWSDFKDGRSERFVDGAGTHDSNQKDDKVRGKGDGNSVWRHDGFFEQETDHLAPRKRPAFREKKIPLEFENASRAAEPRSNNYDRPQFSFRDRQDRTINKPQGVDRFESTRDRRDPHRTGFSLRDRYITGNGNYRGKDRFDERHGHFPSAVRGDKWKHDLFEESNKSPTLKNEEDQIAKVEELLAS